MLFSIRLATMSVIGLLLICVHTAAQTDDAKPASTNVSRAEYPRVHADGPARILHRSARFIAADVATFDPFPEGTTCLTS